MVNKMDSGEIQGGADRSVSCEDPGGMDIIDILYVLASNKFGILIAILLGALLGGGIAFLTPPTYTATATIMPPQQQSSIATALLGQLGGVAGMANQTLGIKNASDPYVGILKSRTISDRLISQFNLRKVYQKKTFADTRRILAKKTYINSAKYSLIQISVEDRDPKRAAAIANAYVDRLQEQTVRLAVTEASQRRLFFERQLEQERAHLAQAESAFKEMQEQKRIFQVSSQMEAVIQSIAKIRAEIVAREVNLQRLKTGATALNPEVLRQEMEISTLRKKMGDLESSRANRSNGDPLMPTTLAPEAGLEYARNLREVKYRESLFELLAKQYEIARIDEAKESPVIQVVDQAIPPDKKSAPFRGLYIAIGGALGCFAGLVVSLSPIRLPIHRDPRKSPH